MFKSMQKTNMTWRARIHAFALAVAIGVAGQTTANDAVVLINGDRITGQIELVTEDSIHLRSQYLGEVVIPRKSVASFGAQEKTMPQTLVPTNETIIAAVDYGQMANLTLPILTTTNETITSNSVDFMQLLTTLQRLAATTENIVAANKLWRSSIDFGFNLSQAAHSTRTFALQLETKREKKPSMLNLQVQAFLGDSDGIATTQKVEGRAKYEYDWLKHWYWYNQFSTTYDRFRGLDLELQEGPGAGFRFLDSPRQKLALEAGPTYLLLVQNDHQQRQSLSLRIAQKYVRKLNDLVSLDENLEFIQRTDIFAARQFRGELSLVVTLTRMLSWRMTLLDEYITHPVLNTPENSLQFISSLGVRF